MDNKNSLKKQTHFPIFLKIVLPILFLGVFIYFLYSFILPQRGDNLFNVNRNNDPIMLEEIDVKTVKVSIEPTPFPKNTTVNNTDIIESTNELTPSSSTTYESSTYALLSLNDNHPSVENLQLRLMELGYLESDEPGTVFNEATRSAVEMFQRAINIVITGIADVETQESLFDKNALPYEVKSGSSGNDIRSMQGQLYSLGYYNNKINGYFGTATEDALIAFQKKNKLSTDGVYNIDDRDLLYSDNARPLIDLTPSPKPENKTKKKSTGSTSKASQKQDNKNNKNVSIPSSETNKDSVIIITEESPDNDNNSSIVPVILDDEEPVIHKSYNATGDVEGVISCAEAQIGKKYVGGDEGPDTFDCSGLVYYCLSQNGVNIKRRSAASYAESSSWALISTRDELIRGDLMFFKDDSSSRVSHTAIYIGGGMMIDASSSNGKVVKRSCTSGYWVRNFICGRRVF